MANKVEMSQERAQYLFVEGATLVFLDFPAGSVFGIDYNSWTVGEKFKGIKMIPPGIHYIYFSAVDKNKDVAARIGFMHNFVRKEVLIKKWDPLLEDISSDEISVEEKQRISDNKEELDQFLGAYPYDNYKKWISLTSHISPSLLDQILPLSGKILTETPLQSIPSNSQSRLKAKQDSEALNKANAADSSTQADSRTTKPLSEADILPEMKPVPGTEIRFSKVETRAHHTVGTSAAVLTKSGMDRSQLFTDLLSRYRPEQTEGQIQDDISPSSPTCKDEDRTKVLGEIQLAFVCFIIGQVYDAFEQWKRLVDLMCSCVDAMSSYPRLYSDFISTIHHEINEIPEDFFLDIVSRENFLTTCLSKLFENVDSCEIMGGGQGGDRMGMKELKGKAERFRKHLERKFEWDFVSETGEYAPVVVDLD